MFSLAFAHGNSKDNIRQRSIGRGQKNGSEYGNKYRGLKKIVVKPA